MNKELRIQTKGFTEPEISDLITALSEVDGVAAVRRHHVTEGSLLIGDMRASADLATAIGMVTSTAALVVSLTKTAETMGLPELTRPVLSALGKTISSWISKRFTGTSDEVVSAELPAPDGKQTTILQGKR